MKSFLKSLMVVGLVYFPTVPGVLAQDIEEVVVYAPRLPPIKEKGEIITKEDINVSPSLRLDEILKNNLSFSLFRRAGSLSAHPTTQGPSLAAIGANGAARALVVLDGIPLNDPFGGWVYWSAIDPGLINSVHFLKGGNSGPWGSGGLSGTIEMISHIPESFFEIDAEGGKFATYNIRSRVSFSKDKTLFVLGAGFFDTNGYFLVPGAQRGPADVLASSNTKNFSGRVSTPFSGAARIEFHLKYFSEDRVNGLLFSTNQTEAFDGGVRLIQNSPEKSVNWEFNLYARDRKFENSFASVNASRTTTRKVLDQFDVPASEVGLNGRLRKRIGETFVLESGFDARFLKGFTNENFRNLGAGFTRVRIAGGNQTLIGGFLNFSKSFLDENLTLTAGARLDYWSLVDGIIREESLEVPEQIIRNDQILDRKDFAPTGKIGATYSFDTKTEIRAFFFTGFRVPTLNEFFRPFRVGNDITEANPLLNPEKLKGFEVGLNYSPHDELQVDFSFILNRVKGGVGNITLAFGPGFFPPTGFVPAGGVLRQRQNIDLIVNKAFEARLLWSPTTNLEIKIDYLFQKSTIARFIGMPDLVGNTLIQTPKHKASFSLRAEVTKNLFFTGQIRFEGKQFDDDQNLRILPEIFVADFLVRHQLTKQASLTFSALNIFDEQIVSGLNTNGLITIGQPRTFLAGVELNF